MTRPGLRHDEIGSGLVELLVSFAILAIAGTGLFYVASLATTGTTSSRDQAAATALAIAKIEELKNAAFDDLVSGSDGPLSAEGTTGLVFSRTWTVTPTSPSGVDARVIVVTVAWDTSRAISLQTLVVEPSETVVDGEISHVQGWNQVK